jgi:hypothetical protein
VKRFAELGVGQLILVGFADSLDDLMRQLDGIAETLIVPGTRL